MHERFSDVLDEFWARPAPALTRRDIRPHRIPGKVDALVGMRRAGKTSLLNGEIAALHAAGLPPNRAAYVNFEDERLAGVRVEHLEQLHAAFLRKGPGREGDERWYFLDEVQNVPGWERFVRRMVDTPGVRLMITGSSSKMLSQELATAMRGRSLSTEVLPFSFREFLRHRGEEPHPDESLGEADRGRLAAAFDSYREVGGFPEVQRLVANQRDAVLQDYVHVVLLRDVIERHGLSQPRAVRAVVRRLLQAPAASASANQLTKDLKSLGLPVGREFVAALLDHLEDAFLVAAVPIATESEHVRRVHPPKIYPIDPALSAAAFLGRDPHLGGLFEALVYLELRRRGAELAWVRTPSGFEVDFLASWHRRTPALVQACLSLSDPDTRARELRALVDAAAAYPGAELQVVTLREQGTVDTPAGPVSVVPAWRWFLGAAEQAR